VSAISSHASLLGDEDLYLFNEGSHFRIAGRLGAHPASGGSHFGVWASAAVGVSVIGDFNGWDPGADQLSVRGSSGIWEAFVPGAAPGAIRSPGTSRHPAVMALRRT
jgi:1,4-alpha-glucan branching enzyme